MIKDRLSYISIRLFLFPFSLMPLSWIRKIGKCLGFLGFHCLREFRKSSLSNLALAKKLHLSNKECYKLSKQSFQNLAITCLEFPKLIRKRQLEKMVRCENPEEADEIMASGKGIIFFCGHQSNWEALFFDGTRRMKGAAIGKAFKNPFLSSWIQSGRESLGGKIIPPKRAFREGLATLKRGAFLGIVGDQGMPDSGYSYPFLGRKMWFSPLPALFAIRSGSPIIVATTKRVREGYRIDYSKAIWPEKGAPLKKEMKRLMDISIHELEKSIEKRPGEWFWQHNCWKQQTPENIFRRFRKDAILIILPEKKERLDLFLQHLSTFRAIYPEEFLYLMVPEKASSQISSIDIEEIFTYKRMEDLKRKDLRFKLVFNFSPYDVTDHFSSLSSFEVITYPTLYRLASPFLPQQHTISDILIRAVSREGTLWRKEDAS